jgi:hypothetical protein
MSAEQIRSPESVVRKIRRKTRRTFTPSEKIRTVLEGLKGERASPSPAAVRASIQICIITGAKIFLRLARSGSGGIRSSRRTEAS